MRLRLRRRIRRWWLHFIELRPLNSLMSACATKSEKALKRTVMDPFFFAVEGEYPGRKQKDQLISAGQQLGRGLLVRCLSAQDEGMK